MIDALSETKRWWVRRKEENKQYNIYEEMTEYLKADVMVQMKIIKQFGDMICEELDMSICFYPTISSVAMGLWKRQFLTDGVCQFKLTSLSQYLKIHDANRGGLTTVLGDFHYDVKDHPGEKMLKVDVTSLYPSACKSHPLTKDFFVGFPNVTRYTEKVYSPPAPFEDVQNIATTGTGFMYVSFDQRHLKQPVLLVNVEHRKMTSLTFVKQSKGWYSFPMLRYAFSRGVKMWVHEILHDYSPPVNLLAPYMDYLAQMKNEGDRLKKVPATKSQGIFKRTIAKFLLNSLLGRLNMNPTKPTTLLSKCPFEVMSIVGNQYAYIDPVNEFIDGDEEGDGFYMVNMQSFGKAEALIRADIAPHVTAYMLDYSKILMLEYMRIADEMGLQLLYTDTDSILMAGKEEAIDQYERYVVPPNGKRFGWMDSEGHPDEFISIGPKKYITRKGAMYEYKANGIRAARNIGVNIYETFKSVLYDNAVAVVNDFSIKGTGMILTHSMPGLQKKVRLRKFKGKITQDKKIQWWESDAEYAAYVDEVINEEEQEAMNAPIAMQIDE